MTPRHFLTLKDLSKKEFKKILERAAELKQAQHKGVIYQPFIGKVMAMPVSKDTLVRVEDFSKIIAITLPMKG